MDYELTAKWHEPDKVQVGLKDVVVLRPDFRVADGYIQYSTDGGSTRTNLIAVAELKGGKGDPGAKGDPGGPGKDGHSPVVTATKSGKTTTISVDGAAIATVEDGADGAPGKDGADGTNGKDGVDGKPGAAGADGAKGADGITPHIGDNGNWYIGSTDTGKPSRGATGAKGDAGATGPAGPAGPQGHAGAPGKDGAPGAPGAQGEKGEKGEKGDPGTPGAAGHTPVKGTDYWTAADKQEIVNDVLAALPDGTEVSY